MVETRGMSVSDDHPSNCQRRKVAEINEILAALERSGLIQAKFAQNHRIGYLTLCSCDGKAKGGSA